MGFFQLSETHKKIIGCNEKKPDKWALHLITRAEVSCCTVIVCTCIPKFQAKYNVPRATKCSGVAIQSTCTSDTIAPYISGSRRTLVIIARRNLLKTAIGRDTVMFAPTDPVLLPRHVLQPGYNDKYLHCFLTLAKILDDSWFQSLLGLCVVTGLVDNMVRS